MRTLSFCCVVILLPLLSCEQKNNSIEKISGVDLPKNLSDSALLDSIEHRTFEFFWTGAEPNSGMAPERIHMDGDYPDKDPRIIATGGSGFGVMAILAGIERKYITREQGLQGFE